MIYLCDEFRRKASKSPTIEKMLRYLDKTNQDVVVTLRETKPVPKARTAQTHVHQVSGTVANVKANSKQTAAHHRKRSPLLQISGNRFGWNRSHTLRLKSDLQSYGLSIHSLSRVGDLGLRSPQETVPIGVILKVSYNLSMTRVDKRDVLCYALTYTGYDAVIRNPEWLSDYPADILIYSDIYGNWQLATLS